MKFTALSLGIIFLLIVGWLAFGGKLGPKKQVHYHAGFVVFENNEKLDFSDFKYMHYMPCVDDQREKESPKDNQIEKAHLHDNIGDVVHVHREGAKWRDLFINLNFPIDYAKSKGYIEGEEVGDFENKKIEPYESIVIFIGQNDMTNLNEAPAKDHIIKVEEKSDGC